MTGKRNVEQEAISRLLEGRGLSLFEVPSDGDCMFAGERYGLKNYYLNIWKKKLIV